MCVCVCDQISQACFFLSAYLGVCFLSLGVIVFVSMPSLLSSTEAPGAGAMKFNIPKRPYVMTNQSFPPGEQPTGLAATPSSPAAAPSAPGGAQTR